MHFVIKASNLVSMFPKLLLEDLDIEPPLNLNFNCKNMLIRLIMRYHFLTIILYFRAHNFNTMHAECIIAVYDCAFIKISSANNKELFINEYN